MNTLTTDQKQEALNNALRYIGFPKKYFINATAPNKTAKFYIACKDEIGGVRKEGREMTYEEMNAYIIGYHRALTNPF